MRDSRVIPATVAPGPSSPLVCDAPDSDSVDKRPSASQNAPLFAPEAYEVGTELANSPQARKRARQADKHRQHNGSQRSTMRTFIKKVRNAVREGDHEQAMAAFRAAEPVIDRYADKGLLHKNTAARYKSRLNREVKKLAGS